MSVDKLPSLWDQFLASDLAITRRTLTPYHFYTIVVPGSQGTVVSPEPDAHLKVYSGVHAMDTDLPYRLRDGLELAKGELVVCAAHRAGRGRWEEPRLVPAVRFSLTPPDNISSRMGRLTLFACIRPGTMRQVLERFGPQTHLTPP